MRSVLLACVMLGLLGRPADARADAAEDPAALWIAAPDAQAHARWQAPLERWFARHGERVVAVLALAATRTGVAPARLADLDRAELRLAEARAALARLDERGAIEILAGAIDALERTSLDLPGVQHWLAELELALGVTAIQLGADALARTAFQHALTLDPERELGAAEAPPEVVAAYRALAQQRATQGAVRVGIDSEPDAASVRVDGRDVGRTPIVVELSPGRHLLQLERAGQHPHAQWLEVFGAFGATVTVQLGDDEDAQLASLLSSASAPELLRLRLERFTQAHSQREVWWLEPSASVPARALLHHCARGQCVAQALELDPRQVARERALSDAQLYLYLDPPRTSAPSRDERSERSGRTRLRWLGAATGVLAAAVVTAVILSRDRDEPEPVRRIVIDSSELAQARW